METREHAGANATVDITGPTALLAGFVDLWMDGLEWTLTAAGARAPRLRRHGPTVREDDEGRREETVGSPARPPARVLSLSPPPPLFARQARGTPYPSEWSLERHSLPELDRPAPEAPREAGARAARRELEEGLTKGLMSGRAVVGARVPGALDVGALVAELLSELARGSSGALPALLVTNSEAIVDAALAHTRQLLPGPRRAGWRRRGPVVGLRHRHEVWAAIEWFRQRPPARSHWRTIFVDGVDVAKSMGIGNRPPPEYLMGASVVVVSDAIGVQPDSLKRLLRRPLDVELGVGAAMLRGVLPMLNYGLVVDPVDHVSVATHIRWFHPGKAGEALSKDDRLEALLNAGAFLPESNCLIHVAEAAQANWAREWLKRRLGRAVEPARRRPARRPRGAIRETEPKEFQAGVRSLRTGREGRRCSLGSAAPRQDLDLPTRAATPWSAPATARSCAPGTSSEARAHRGSEPSRWWDGWERVTTERPRRNWSRRSSRCRERADRRRR